MTDLADYHQHGVGSFFILKQKNQQCLLKILISKHFQVVVDDSLDEKINLGLHGKNVNISTNVAGLGCTHVFCMVFFSLSCIQGERDAFVVYF